METASTDPAFFRQWSREQLIAECARLNIVLRDVHQTLNTVTNSIDRNSLSSLNEQYKCQSYYDDTDKTVKDCTCGKCAVTA